MNETYARVSGILDCPEPTYPIDEPSWHKRAVDVFTQTQDPELLTRSVAETSMKLLQFFPFEYMEDFIQKAPLHPKKFKELRKLRKILTLGRDSLNYSNTTDLIDIESTEPFRNFVMGIGEITDTHCTDLSLINHSVESIESAACAILDLPENYIEPVAFDIFRHRLANGSATDILLNKDVMSYSEDHYHLARQSFRAVVYTGITSYVVEPSESKLQFMLEGLRINRTHGDMRNRIKAKVNENEE